MTWTVSCTVTDADGSSRVVSGARLRCHEAWLLGSCPVVYLSAGPAWAVSPLLAGWGAWLLLAGLAVAALAGFVSRFPPDAPIAKVIGWLVLVLAIAGLGQRALGFRPALLANTVAALAFLPCGGPSPGWPDLRS